MTKLWFFFKIPRPHFQNSFSPTFLYVFCAKLKDTTLKSYWKPNTSVLCVHNEFLQIFTNFGAFLLLCGLVSITFTKNVIGSDHIFKTVFPNFLYVFCSKLKDTTLKSYWKPNTSVLCVHNEFYKFLPILEHFCCFAA